MDIIECRGVRYAAGLYWWQAAERADLRAPQRTARRLVREIGGMVDSDAGSPGYDTVVIDRAGGRIGLGASGTTERVRALALALALARPKTGVLWCLAFEPGQRIVIATVNGRVLGEGDYVGSETGARARMALLLEHYGDQLSERIEGERGDAGWALLEDALGAVPPSSLPRTRSLHRPRREVLVWSLAGLLLLGLGIWGWTHRVALTGIRDSGRRSLSTRKTRGGPPLAAVLRAIRGPAPRSVLSVCRREWRSLELIDEGWSFARFICTARRASVVWRYRPGASFVHLPHRAVMTSSPHEVVSSYPLQPGPETTLTQGLIPRTRVEGNFYEWVRAVGIQAAAFSWQGTVPGRLSPWSQAEWSVAMKGNDPFRLGPDLAAFHGLSIRRMEATLSLNGRLVWHLEGVIYANPL
jgi:hypothetical protein